MSKADMIELEGEVTKMSHGMYTVSVKLPGNENKPEKEQQLHEVNCSLSGKLRQNFIRVIVGDTVTIEVSQYDLSRGIITYRKK